VILPTFITRQLEDDLTVNTQRAGLPEFRSQHIFLSSINVSWIVVLST
jgi:hypothetical protein